MTTGYHALTEREKQTLRLIVRGHDAKSTARHLGLSVHTINERLRDARRKLEVSSSREAARLVLETESASYESLGDSELGEAARTPLAPSADPTPELAFRDGVIRGLIAMSILLAILAVAGQPYPPVEAPETTSRGATSDQGRAENGSSTVADVPPVRCKLLGDARNLDEARKTAKSRGESLRLACGSLRR